MYRSRSTAFFLDGHTRDTAYSNARDLPQAVGYRRFVDELWKVYQPYADANFQSNAKYQFLQRFWEMYWLSVCLSVVWLLKNTEMKVRNSQRA